MAGESGVVRVVWYSLRRHTLHGRQGRSLPTVSPKHSLPYTGQEVLEAGVGGDGGGGGWGGVGTDC